MGMDQSSSKYRCMCFTWKKKVIQVWKDTKVNKWWEIFYFIFGETIIYLFCETNPLTSIFKLL